MNRSVRKIRPQDALSEFKRMGLIPVIIRRSIVESSDIGPVVDFLKKMSANKNLWKNRNALVIHFEGWQDDPRPYFEIPELVSYFRAVSSEWNYWLWFVNVSVPDNVRMVVGLLLDAARSAVSDEGRIFIPSGEDVDRQFSQVMNTLCKEVSLLLRRSGRDAVISRELVMYRLNLWLPILGASPA